MRWGGKQDSERHVCGPFDWTKDEERITPEGWEGWLAVRLPDDEKRAKELGMKNGQGLWRLYFDEHDHGVDLPPDAEALEVTLKRTISGLSGWLELQFGTPYGTSQFYGWRICCHF